MGQQHRGGNPSSPASPVSRHPPERRGRHPAVTCCPQPGLVGDLGLRQRRQTRRRHRRRSHAWHKVHGRWQVVREKRPQRRGGGRATTAWLLARPRDLATGGAAHGMRVPRPGGSPPVPRGDGCGGCSRLGDAGSALGSTPLGYRLPWPGTPGTGVGHSGGPAGDDGVRLAACCPHGEG